jgi:hypothetical protein
MIGTVVEKVWKVTALMTDMLDGGRAVGTAG